MARLKRDLIYYAFFSMHLVAILLVDMVPLYPSMYWKKEGGILRILYHIRQYYIDTFNDPYFQMEHDQVPPWYTLFLYLEVIYQIPMNIWIRTACGEKEGTSPVFEVFAVAYGVQVALTTLVCIWDVAYWDPAVYTVQDKNIFVFGLYGPFVLIPLIFSFDMGRRLLTRISDANKGAVVEKKTQ